MKGFRLGSVILGFIIPFCGIVVAVPFVNNIGGQVMGIPLTFFWIFLWFPLTWLCLTLSYRLWDRKDYEQRERRDGR